MFAVTERVRLILYTTIRWPSRFKCNFRSWGNRGANSLDLAYKGSRVPATVKSLSGTSTACTFRDCKIAVMESLNLFALTLVLVFKLGGTCTKYNRTFGSDLRYSVNKFRRSEIALSWDVMLLQQWFIPKAITRSVYCFSCINGIDGQSLHVGSTLYTQKTSPGQLRYGLLPLRPFEPSWTCFRFESTMRHKFQRIMDVVSSSYCESRKLVI